MKKFIFLTLLFLVFLPNSAKGYCDDSEIIRLQKLASNVTVSYTYDEDTRRFSVTLSNLKSDLEVIEIDSMKKYNTVGDLTFKKLYSGKHGYIIYAKNKECSSSELTTKYAILPYENPLHNLDICKGIENYSYCNKWVSNSISYEAGYQKINEYREKLASKKNTTKNNPSTLSILFGKIKEVYGKYYYIILPVVIVTLLIMIAIKNKKESLV